MFCLAEDSQETLILISLRKQNEEIFKTVVCCSRDWRPTGLINKSTCIMQIYMLKCPRHTILSVVEIVLCSLMFVSIFD